MKHMPEMSLEEAESALRADGRFAWLLGGRQAWSVTDVAEEYRQATEVPVSGDTVLRWFRRIGKPGAENYGGTIGWRARRDALIRFFAEGRHLRNSDDAQVAN